MTDKLSRRRIIGITVGSATAALAGCLGDDGSGDSNEDDSVSESGEPDPTNETGSEEEAAENVSEEETAENETEDETAAEPETNVVTVGPEDSPTMFDPEMLTVESGTTVTFEWATDNHNLVVENQPTDANWTGEEEIQNAGYSHEHTFDVEGEYEYICEPHAPDMSGVIVVEGGMDDGTDSTGNESTADDPENGTADDDTM